MNVKRLITKCIIFAIALSISGKACYAQLTLKEYEQFKLGGTYCNYLDTHKEGNYIYLFQRDAIAYKLNVLNKQISNTKLKSLEQLNKSWQFRDINFIFSLTVAPQYFYTCSADRLIIHTKNGLAKYEILYAPRGIVKQGFSISPKLKTIEAVKFYDNPFAFVDPDGFLLVKVYHVFTNINFDYKIYKKDFYLIKNKKQIIDNTLHPKLPLLSLYAFDTSATVKEVRIPKYPSSFFNKNMRLLGHIGERDSFLWNGSTSYHYYCGNQKSNFFVDTAHKKTLLNLDYSSKIQVYDYQGKKINEFGKPGKHLAEKDTLAYVNMYDVISETGYKSYKQWHAWYEKAKPNIIMSKRYQTVNYMDIFYNQKLNLTFRLYSKPDKINIQDSLINLEKNNPPNYLDLLESLFISRPTYLQIYDHNNNDELIFDEPVPGPFKVLEIDAEGYLWAVAGKQDDNFVIRKYKIMRE